MTDAAYSVPQHPIAPTVLLLTAGAALGAVWGLFLAFVGSTVMAAAGGPLALLIAAPLLFAVYGLGMMYVIIGVPLWGLLGGFMFGALASGKEGSAARDLGLTFFPESHPIAQTTQRMAKQLGLPPVAFIGWYNADDVNAFAMGVTQDDALIAVSQGAVEQLSKDQLDAVLAHELGHVASNDMARMTYARGVREALTFFLLFRGLKKLARWIFTPLSELELLRFSRAREFTADAISAHLTSPYAMISVLEALKDGKEEPRSDDRAMIMFAALGRDSWLSTHPPLEARIEALRASPSTPITRKPDLMDPTEAAEPLPG
ncbi:heat shock protein HtpX [Breoghania corrubedonensis]|uniref:Heat shock protein HtpX n=1 Tax=Breoghania corrubedonensis TaxID=665038 RepID=A0A2T5VD64_9HYPH|nr:M48 family metalloprotease [Breoghania corrubedonensis]PTW61693.1 heat shock protein HtpX [Breoghania corrubedonensis]